MLANALTDAAAGTVSEVPFRSPAEGTALQPRTWIGVQADRLRYAQVLHALLGLEAKLTPHAVAGRVGVSETVARALAAYHTDCRRAFDAARPANVAHAKVQPLLAWLQRRAEDPLAVKAAAAWRRSLAFGDYVDVHDKTRLSAIVLLFKDAGMAASQLVLRASDPHSAETQAAVDVIVTVFGSRPHLDATPARTDRPRLYLLVGSGPSLEPHPPAALSMRGMHMLMLALHAFHGLLGMHGELSSSIEEAT